MTDIVRRMTREGIRRLEQLEVLLVMVRRPADGWTAKGLSDASMLTAEAAADALGRLHELGFVEQPAGAQPTYKLGPRAAIDDLLLVRRVYERDRVRVVNEFFGSNLAVLRDFADAFKIRGDS